MSEQKPRNLQDKKSERKHFLLTTIFQLPEMISDLRVNALLTSLNSKLASRPITSVLYALVFHEFNISFIVT